MSPHGAAPRVALVHDWLTGMRGGEWCLHELCAMFPGAALHCLFHRPGSVTELIEARTIHESVLGHLPGIHRLYKGLLPLLPAAARGLRPRDVDLVVSLSHCVAHGVTVPEGVPHLAYVFTPMRYAWDRRDDYLAGGGLPAPLRPLARAFLEHLRTWDRQAGSRPERVLAISHYVAGRVERAWERPAEVLYPPVDCDRFAAAPPGDGGYYLVSAARAPYKRVDLAVEACARSGRRLVVTGRKPTPALRRRLMEVAAGNGGAGGTGRTGGSIEYLDWVEPERLVERVAGCRAFLMPWEEEFGIAAVETQAAGRPVIALARGAAPEFVVPPDDPAGRPATGLLPDWPSSTGAAGRKAHDEAAVTALIAAMDRLEAQPEAFDPEAIRAHARAFDRRVFRRRMVEVIRSAVQRASGCDGPRRRGEAVVPGK